MMEMSGMAIIDQDLSGFDPEPPANGTSLPTPPIGREAKLSNTEDINDANREKIVIRPKCKLYVEKQRSLRATLSCFVAPKVKDQDSSPKPDTQTEDQEPKAPAALRDAPAPYKGLYLPPPNSIVIGIRFRRRKLRAPELLGADVNVPTWQPTTPAKRRSSPAPSSSSGSIDVDIPVLTPTTSLTEGKRVPRTPTAPRALRQAKVVASGRIEKSPRPISVPAPRQHPTPAFSRTIIPPDLPIEISMRLLAEEFASIVSRQQELIRQREMEATMSMALCTETTIIV